MAERQTHRNNNGSAAPHAESTTGDRRSRLRRIALLSQVAAAGVLALVIAIVVGFQVAASGAVRSGVTAFGVPLGGMDREEARAVLEDARDVRSSQSLWLMDGTDGWELTESDLGVTMDIDGALDAAFAAGNEGFGPSRLALTWRFGGHTEVAADKIAVRGDVLENRINQLASDIDKPMIDPELEIYSDGTYAYRNAQIGRAVDVNATRENILRSLTTGLGAAVIAVNETHPFAYDEDYAHAINQLENVLNGPITLVAADREWTLTPDQLAYRLRLVPPENGQEAMIKVDESWVDAVVYEIAWATDRSPRTPRVWWDVGGQLTVIEEGVYGQQFDSDTSRSAIMDVFLGLSSAERVDLPVAMSPPPELPSDLSTLGIRSLITEASTPYGGGAVPERAHNIELAAKLLNGTIVLPGQVFSFNAEIGPMTTDAGFQVAYGIANEGGDLRTVPAEAGGICQVSSTVFQPVFWTGYQIERRSTHSFWIPSYTSRGIPGLDATVDGTPNLDFRWMNNSPTAILIEAVADGDNFIVRLYGTPPDWTVEVDEPIITNIVEANAEEVLQDDPTLPAGKTLRIERATDGFDVRIVRKVHENDGNVRELVLDTSYGPSRNVVLVGTGEAVADPVASTP
jgi:vancomycin resistance protein YoaR